MLKTLWNKWKIVAEKIGDLQFSLIFSIFYYVFVVPLGLIVGFFKDILGTKGFPEWQRIDRDFDSIKSLREQ